MQIDCGSLVAVRFCHDEFNDFLLCLRRAPSRQRRLCSIQVAFTRAYSGQSSGRGEPWRISDTLPPHRWRAHLLALLREVLGPLPCFRRRLRSGRRRVIRGRMHLHTCACRKIDVGVQANFLDNTRILNYKYRQVLRVHHARWQDLLIPQPWPLALADAVVLRTRCLQSALELSGPVLRSSRTPRVRRTRRRSLSRVCGH